jgi:predicted Rossmann fold nucleotide-binding protein DprA/Smf involved in DNA uptake
LFLTIFNEFIISDGYYLAKIINKHIIPMYTYSESSINKITDIDTVGLLSKIPDKPKKLFYCGNQNLLSNPSLKFVCIIGSRKHTRYGSEVCQTLISALKGYPVVIVSGLALGIDGHAHRIALENNLACIAVPGSGIDPESLYPRSHVHLAEEDTCESLEFSYA